MTERDPFSGATKKLLVAVDIGTTFTAVSFSILIPGEVPQFNQVLRWPLQATPDAKVPSVIYYDTLGNAQAHGAETEDDEVVYNAEAKGWQKASWWKLRLRPTHLPIINDLSLPALPPFTTVEKILTHFLKYVKEQLRAYIATQYGDGAIIWQTLHPMMDLVLTVPNGWEITQQQIMRTAALQSTLMSGRQPAKRIRFVSEAEAAVLYAIESGCIGEWLVNGAELILCDCGGGTIDIASYKVTGLRPLRLEETTAAGCYLAGAVYVTEACKMFLKDHLCDTEWGGDEALERVVAHFERNAKRKFESVDSPSWIELGGFKSVPELGIVRGKLKLPGTTVASFFSRSLQYVKEGLELAWRSSNFRAQKVILVGGLSSSPYVYKELQTWGTGMGMSVSRPDRPTTKAVADGALSWHLDSSVTARVNKYYYGTKMTVPWDGQDSEITNRNRFVDHAGEWRVDGCWSPIVAKDARIQNGFEYKQDYHYKIRADETNFVRLCDVWVYRWDQPSRFITFPDDSKNYPGFELLCTVQANLQAPFKAAMVQSGTGGQKFRAVSFNLCLSFGDTELTARLSWKEKKNIKYSNATITQRPLAPDAQ